MNRAGAQISPTGTHCYDLTHSLLHRSRRTPRLARQGTVCIWTNCPLGSADGFHRHTYYCIEGSDEFTVNGDWQAFLDIHLAGAFEYFAEFTKLQKSGVEAAATPSPDADALLTPSANASHGAHAIAATTGVVGPHTPSQESRYLVPPPPAARRGPTARFVVQPELTVNILRPLQLYEQVQPAFAPPRQQPQQGDDAETEEEEGDEEEMEEEVADAAEAALVPPVATPVEIGVIDCVNDVCVVAPVNPLSPPPSRGKPGSLVPGKLWSLPEGGSATEYGTAEAEAAADAAAGGGSLQPWAAYSPQSVLARLLPGLALSDDADASDAGGTCSSSSGKSVATGSLAAARSSPSRARYEDVALPLPLDGLCLQTQLTRCLGPIDGWLRFVRDGVTRERMLAGTLAEPLACKFNMLHFTPVQRLGGSNSAYSLSDQLCLEWEIFAGNAAVNAAVASVKREMGPGWLDALLASSKSSSNLAAGMSPAAKMWSSALPAAGAAAGEHSSSSSVSASSSSTPAKPSPSSIVAAPSPAAATAASALQSPAFAIGTPQATAASPAAPAAAHTGLNGMPPTSTSSGGPVAAARVSALSFIAPTPSSSSAPAPTSSNAAAAAPASPAAPTPTSAAAAAAASPAAGGPRSRASSSSSTTNTPRTFFSSTAAAGGALMSGTPRLGGASTSSGISSSIRAAAEAHVWSHPRVEAAKMAVLQCLVGHLEAGHGVLSMVDVVLNHTSTDSAWLR